MNHIRRSESRSSCAFNACHPERGLATSEASRQTQSKDPYSRNAAGGQSKNFRIAVRFFDEQRGKAHDEPSREAEFVSAGRKTWVVQEERNESRRDATLAASTRNL